MRVSAIVITKNAGATLWRCLESLEWADEIVVVDSGSTDNTVALARTLGARVHETADWPGYGPQKNRALRHASGDWVLSIDADEWVPPAARDEMQRVLAGIDARPAYAIPRRSSFCGRVMKHSGWWPDYVVRLFRRGAARFSDDLAHERLVVDGAIGKLKEPLMHEAIVDLDQMLGKMNGYSTASALMLSRSGKRATLAGAVLHGWWAFVRTYFLRLGVLDGREGFMLAVANAEGSYYRYVKLMLHSEKRQ
jgi:glycosyltransferase involved in cell wall biosynthesis